MKTPPFRVTLAVWLVLIVTVWNILRFWTSISWRETLQEYPGRMDPAYISIASGAWIILGILLVYSIWSNQKWAGKLLTGSTWVYSIIYWLERMLWQEAHRNWQFAIILNFIAIFFVIFINKPLARERYERKP